jgi:hypothetical protein
MKTASFGEKISWFFHQAGLSARTKPGYLHVTKFAEPEWFKVAETLIKDNNLEGRKLILDYLLKPNNFKGHPKRSQFIRFLGFFITKGIIDERRRVVRYIDDHINYFHIRDEALFGPLMTAQRDSDIQIANAAESAVKKLKGEDLDPML